MNSFVSYVAVYFNLFVSYVRTNYDATCKVLTLIILGGSGGEVAPSVHTDVAWKLPQFKQLGVVLLCVASGG